VRDNRGKAKQVTTFNGRTVIIKENSVYSNKGGRTKNHWVIVSIDLETLRLQIPYSGPAPVRCTLLHLIL
jgi:hypothetical protein